MQHPRLREPRKSVRIRVRVRTDDGWIEATVGNVSNRGMMVHSPCALSRNQYVEVARGNCRVVGRIVWSDGGRFGIQSRETIDLDSLLMPPRGDGAGSSEIRQPKSIDTLARPALSFEDRAAASRLSSRAFEHTSLVVIGAGFALMAVAALHEALAEPLRAIEVALATPA